MKSLTISSWNIQGLHSSAFGTKSRNVDFVNKIINLDIIVLIETWCNTDTDTHCPKGYIEILLPSIKHNHIKHGRKSGGIIIWYKEKLATKLKLIKKGTTHAWLKLRKGTFNCDNDVFICAAYAPPHDSPYCDEEFFNRLHTEINSFQAQGNILLCGDFNARTGTEPDCIDPAGNSHIFNNLSAPLIPITMTRNNPDKTINKNGKELVHLCRALGLYMLNGRIRGDSLGRFTYCSALGTSVVDYAITDMDPSSISAFTVRPQSPFSDHCQITTFLKSMNDKTFVQNPSKLIQLNQRYKWNSDSATEFNKAISSVEITNSINMLLLKEFRPNSDDVNLAAEEISDIYNRAAKKANLLKNCKNVKRKPSKQKWFDHECREKRKILRQLSNKKHHDQKNTCVRQNYCEALKDYKFTIKKKKQHYYNQTLQQIEDSLQSNTFWESWNHLNNSPPKELAIQNPDTWKTFYQNLYKSMPDNITNEQKHIKLNLKKLEDVICVHQNPLDHSISSDELLKSLKKLKPDKACGPDNIRTEMLKFSPPILQRALLKLFNLVFQAGCFPDVWNRGLISPIHKSGDKSDPKIGRAHV